MRSPAVALDHPILTAAQGLPADQRLAAHREAAAIDHALAAVDALQPGDPDAERLLVAARVLADIAYNRYACYDVRGRLPGWYYMTLTRLRERATALLGESYGALIMPVNWAPLQRR